jgi:hypothetical protein
MNVRPIDPDEAVRLFGDAASIVTTPAWLHAFAGAVQAYGVFEADEVQAVFCLRMLQRFGASACLDGALSPHCGLIFSSRTGSAEKLNTWRKSVLQAMAAFLDRPALAFVSLTFPDWVLDFQPFIWRGFKVLTRYTYQIALQQKDDQMLLGAMSETRRRQLRNGAKNGFVTSLCRDTAIIEKLVARTMERQHAHSDLSAIDRLLTGFENRQNSFAFSTHRDGEPVAVCYCVHDRLRCYYLLGGVDELRSLPPAAPMAMFACIRHARELGLQVFDFEGSDIPGIEKYFRSFGGTLTPLHRVTKAWLPIEMLLKPFKRSQL